MPRLVVRPTIGGRIAGTDPREPKPAIDPETYITSLPDAVQGAVRTFTEDIGGLGGELQWRSYGPRVRVRGDRGPRVMVSLDADYLWIAVGPLKGIDPACGRRAAERLSKIGSAGVGEQWARIKWESSNRDDVVAGLRVAQEFVRELVKPAD